MNEKEIIVEKVSSAKEQVARLAFQCAEVELWLGRIQRDAQSGKGERTEAQVIEALSRGCVNCGDFACKATDASDACESLAKEFSAHIKRIEKQSAAARKSSDSKSTS
jgi:hypothetical protein